MKTYSYKEISDWFLSKDSLSPKKLQKEEAPNSGASFIFSSNFKNLKNHSSIPC